MVTTIRRDRTSVEGTGPRYGPSEVAALPASGIAVAQPAWRWRAVDDPPVERPQTTKQRLLDWLIRYNKY